jgi:hypothetical protein
MGKLQGFGSLLVTSAETGPHECSFLAAARARINIHLRVGEDDSGLNHGLFGLFAVRFKLAFDPRIGP